MILISLIMWVIVTMDQFFPGIIAYLDALSEKTYIADMIRRFIYPAWEKQTLQLVKNGLGQLVAVYNVAIVSAVTFFFIDFVSSILKYKTLYEINSNRIKKYYRDGTKSVGGFCLFTAIASFGGIYYLLVYRSFAFSGKREFISPNYSGVFINGWCIAVSLEIFMSFLLLYIPIFYRLMKERKKTRGENTNSLRSQKDTNE